MLRRLLFITLTICLAMLTSMALANDTRFVTTAYQAVVLFKGPGTTYLQLAQIPAGVPMTIIERNSTGTWVHIQYHGNDGSVIYDGWIISGYLNFDLDFHFGDVPVNTTLPDADADTD